MMTSAMEAATTTGEFEIAPQGPYSLAAAASFEFGPKEPVPEDSVRLAFALDDFSGTAAVALGQDGNGSVRGAVQGSSDLAGVRRQVTRILSLDHDARRWPEAGQRDPVIGRLQERWPGFRPMLFHSPYEAAAWSVLYGRKTLTQVRRLRDRVAAQYGMTYTVLGSTLTAFPPPRDLLQVRPQPGLAEPLVERLHAVARFALEGRLETERLRSLEETEALTELRRLPGVGPFFSGLILYRAVGVLDAWQHSEKLDLCLGHYYGIDPADEAAFQAIGDRLHPFRSWAMVLLRRAGYEDGIA